MAINMLPLDATSGSPSFTAQQTRQALSAIFGVAPSGRPLGATSGVRAGTPATTVFLTGAGSTTWNVAAHSGVLDTQTSALAGPYTYATDGTDTGTITAADPTNPRVDIVYVKVNDNVQDGSGLANGQVLYLAGSPAASPSAPATPARSMVLATIAVPKVGAGAPAATWTAPVFGGPQPSASSIVIGGLRVQWGSATISGTISAGATLPTTFTFTTAFTGTPVSWGSITGFVTGATQVVLQKVDTLTSTTGRAVFLNTDSASTSVTNLPFMWFAIGPA